MELINRYLPRTEFSSYDDFMSNFALDCPEDFDFARDIVDEWARLEPDKIALIYCDDFGAEKTITFSEMSRLSKCAAAYFISLGIKKGDRVLTLLRRRWEYWVCAVALHRIGVGVVPASIQLMSKDLIYRVNTAEIKYILTINDDYVFSQLKAVEENCPLLKKIISVDDTGAQKVYESFNDNFEEHGEYGAYSGQKNGDEMVVYFTSGTTGYPKMAIHDRTYPLGHIITARYMQCVQNNGLHLTQADSGWAKFGWGNIYGQWLCGSAILAYDPLRFDASNFLKITAKYKPTSLCIPPTMYRFLLHAGLKSSDVETIKWFSTAGEPLSGEVNTTFYNITGHYIHEGYGQSEGTPITCSFEWIEIRPSSMGRPSPLYKVGLVNPEGQPCEQGEHGEVIIYVKNARQVGLLVAYSVNGEIIDPVKDGLYHTGDIAYMDENGYYWYVGRNDDMIKSSGYRIGPFEIESVLNAHPAVKESAIIGKPDEMRGQIICAVVVLKDGYSGSEALTKELQQYVRENTAPYKYPRVIEYTDALPKTTSGKIIRSALK